MVWRFEKDNVASDVMQVIDTAALLSISEFRLFRLAYRHWYGEEAESSEVEQAFQPYLLHDIVPPWVRSFTRKALGRESAGMLDPAEFGVPLPTKKKPDVFRGKIYFLAVTVALILLVYLADSSASRLGVEGCLFPPCY